MAEFIVLSSSLNPKSRSRILARAAHALMERRGEDVAFVDLVDWPLPLCDGGAAYGHERCAEIKDILLPARGYLIATPIYNYDVSAALKNVIELTGRDVWSEKVVGFACAAGGRSSYMSVMAVANSLMLDFRTVIVPRFVYAHGDDFRDGRIASDAVSKRLESLVNDVVRFTRSLGSAAAER